MSDITLDYGIMLPADFLEADSYKGYSAESCFDCEDFGRNELTKEQSLWKNVIIQAVLDAISIPSNSIARKEKTRAIIWFSMQDKDFINVCEMAGMNPSFVVGRVRKIIKNSSTINKKKQYIKRRRKIKDKVSSSKLNVSGVQKKILS